MLRKDNEYFFEKAKEIHGDRLDYSKVKYKSTHKKVEIICKEHGSFFQTPGNHLQGQSCPKCRSSKGEKRIMEWLDNKRISFIAQKTFDGFITTNGRKYRYDFYIKKENNEEIIIEYDGPQHYKRITGNWSIKNNLEHVKEADKIKDEFCVKNNIKLIRIPYYEYKNISNILEGIFL